MIANIDDVDEGIEVEKPNPKRKYKKRFSRISKGRGALVSVRCNVGCPDLILKKLSVKDMNVLLGSQFGPLFRSPLKAVQGQIIYHLLLCLQPWSEEMGTLVFKINGELIEFGRSDFALITGLSFKRGAECPVSSSFHQSHFGGSSKIMVSDIEKKLKSSRGLKPGDALKLACLHIVYSMFLIQDLSSKAVDLRYIHLVENVEDFLLYDWGRVAYDFLVSGMHHARRSVTKPIDPMNPTVKNCEAKGFIHALQAWAYEVIPNLAKFAAQAKTGFEVVVPRMLRWQPQGRKRYHELIEFFHPPLCSTPVDMAPTSTEVETLSSLGLDYPKRPVDVPADFLYKEAEVKAADAELPKEDVTDSKAKNVPELFRRGSRGMWKDHDWVKSVIEEKLDELKGDLRREFNTRMDSVDMSIKELRDLLIIALKNKGRSDEPSMNLNDDCTFRNKGLSDGPSINLNDDCTPDDMSPDVRPGDDSTGMKSSGNDVRPCPENEADEEQHVENLVAELDRELGDEGFEYVGGKDAEEESCMLLKDGQLVPRDDVVDGIFDSCLDPEFDAELGEYNNACLWDTENASEELAIGNCSLSTTAEDDDLGYLLEGPAEAILLLTPPPATDTGTATTSRGRKKKRYVSAPPNKRRRNASSERANVCSPVHQFDPLFIGSADVEAVEFLAWCDKRPLPDGSVRPSSVRLPTGMEQDCQWFMTIKRARGLLMGDHVDALVLMVLHKFKVHATSKLKRERDWSVLEQPATKAMMDGNLPLARKNVRPYAIGKLPLIDKVPWPGLRRVFGVGNVVGSHWVAYEVNFQMQRITVWDSAAFDWGLVRGAFSTFGKTLAQFLAEDNLWNKMGFKDALSSEWEVVPANKPPQQIGLTDCGVVSVKVLECLCFGINPSELCCKKSVYWRMRLCAELYDYGASGSC